MTRCLDLPSMFPCRHSSTTTMIASLVLLLAAVVIVQSNVASSTSVNERPAPLYRQPGYYHHRRGHLRPRTASGSRSASRVRPCYDPSGRAQRCFPPFVNAAFNVPVEATNTCGVDNDADRQANGNYGGDVEVDRGRRTGEFFCQQTEVHVAGTAKSCDICDDNDPRKAHPASYLTDFHSSDNLTWWQSSTMLSDVQWPYSVNLTLPLGKAFEITYVRLKFHSSRPESFAIYKRSSTTRQEAAGGNKVEDDDSSGELEPEVREEWTPYQFYSSSCEQTYKMTSTPTITPNNEASAICRDDFSDISPLSGASVAFSTLEGRPGAYDFENNLALQDWVVATDIKIVLNRINTFRDEVFGDPNVLRSYFYAISDIAIGGRCLCNGHASDCFRVDILRPSADDPHDSGLYSNVVGDEQGTLPWTPPTSNGQRQLACRCEHHTAGPDCERCLPFYNDRPWRRATAIDANECRPCDCGGLSDECFFDAELYETTGHGGHCINCRENTDGPHCEHCRDEFYRDMENTGQCLPCHCHPEGAYDAQCDSRGMCHCKPGVMGDKCDQCQPHYFDLGPEGCKTCECLEAGSLDNQAECHQGTGICRCKEHVEGRNCDQCKSGYFGLSVDDELGCTPCFCYGHSATCNSSTNHRINSIQSEFILDTDGWTGESRDGQPLPVEFSDSEELIYIMPSVDFSDDVAYMVAPAKFLGDQSFSYNRMLSFSLYLDDERDVTATIADIVIEGGHESSNGGPRLSVSAPIFAQGNPMPSTVVHDFRFRLSERQSHQWTPELSVVDFRRLLANVTVIKIRTSYSRHGMGFLDNVNLVTAEIVDDSAYESRDDGAHQNGRQVALFVEQCQCPPEYEGQFCERCRTGYKRGDVTTSPYARCVACECHSHASSCEQDSGKCHCEHNTIGDKCERCLPGFYGQARTGTPTDCTRCPCPNGGNCVQLLSGDVACLNCPVGHAGLRCDRCDDGYYDDSDVDADTLTCAECGCNNNIDDNSVGNCNSTTGECLKCIYNTTGFFCDRCLHGYYGNALALPHGHCLACNCFALGSQTGGGDVFAPVDCDSTGQCPCLEHVTGNRCETCEDGYWNIVSGTGCEECRCDVIGSMNGSCDILSGQCYCKPGVGGIKCDQCMPNYYLLTYDGCTACECDPEGSVDLQCHLATGECTCRPNVFGPRCSQCAENKYDKAAGCLDCPVCYNEVERQVTVVRSQLATLRDIVVYLENQPPETINDTTFIDQLAAMNASVNQLVEDCLSHGDDPETVERYRTLVLAVEEVAEELAEVEVSYNGAMLISRRAVSQVNDTEQLLDHFEVELVDAELLLDGDGLRTLEEAIEAQRVAGHQSQQLTDDAREARQFADQQEVEAETMTQTADQALATAEESLTLIQEVASSSASVDSDISTITSRLDASSRYIDETFVMAYESHNEAERAYQTSLRTLTQVESLRVSIVNTGLLQQQANSVKEQAGATKRDADELIAQHEGRDQRYVDEINRSNSALDSAREKRQVTDSLMDAVSEANATAYEAVEAANRMLIEANETLSTLRVFDETVRLSRDEAEAAVAQIPAIERNVENAEQSTTAARVALGEAEADSEEASILAQSGQERAVTALQRIIDLRRDVNATLLQVNELLDQSNLTEVEINDIEERLLSLEQQAEDDSQLIQRVLQETGEARSIAERTSEEVSATLNSVNDILAQLERTQPVDLDQLDDVEQTLNTAHRRLAEIDLEGHFAALEIAEADSSRWVAEYSAQMLAISEDVAIISVINQTLPRTCFKKIVLEPREAQVPTTPDIYGSSGRRFVY